MRLLIVTQYYPPEMGAPQARLSELATRLRDRGHEVSVLTAMPNYPTGKVFAGYRGKLRTVEMVDGIRVTRTCIWPSKSRRSLPRLLSYMSFVFSSVALGTWGLGRQDVVLFESPPLFMVPAGLLVGRLTGAKVIMNCSDIWPDILVRRGHVTGGPFLKAMFWLEKFGYEHADVVAVTNPGARQQVRERFPRVEVTVISNGVDTHLFRPELRGEQFRAELGAGSDDFLVGYCGLHGLAQGLEAVINAAEKLKDRTNIKFVMIGDGPTKDLLVSMAREKQLENVRFFDPRPKREIPPILASCEVSLVPLTVRLPGTMPSKTYEALASGTPPVVAKGCEADPLVTRHNAGRAFEPQNADELAAALLELAEDPAEYARVRENCIKLARRFDRNVIAERTNEVLLAIHQGGELPEVVW